MLRLMDPNEILVRAVVPSFLLIRSERPTCSLRGAGSPSVGFVGFSTEGCVISGVVGGGVSEGETTIAGSVVVDGGGSVVATGRSGGREETEVATGRSGGNSVEVVDGATEVLVRLTVAFWAVVVVVVSAIVVLAD